ncbi:MAG: hypothetical protein QY317_16410 [Candidatus Jettenia caeni]|nr:MAG: hypothetical protein QY317_16410 [Candidatus Jettenia caeni]
MFDYVIAVSEDEEVCLALKRTLKAARGITVLRFTEDTLRDENSVILLFTPECELPEWLYEKIRSKYLNPVIVIGFEEKDFFEKEYPLFYDHPYNHAYLKIPFSLIDFINLLENTIPLSSQEIRSAICGSEPGYKGYLLKLLSHDLLKDKNRCIDILTLVEKFLDNKELSDDIRKATEKIKAEVKWNDITYEIGKRLEYKLKENKDVKKG